MKKIILLIIVLLTSNLNSQTLPIDTYENIPNGAYLKDLDGEYLPYVGTWKGIKNNKEYTFVFQIFYDHLNSYSSTRYYYEDCLNVKYQVKDILTNTILYTTMSATSFNDFPIIALGTPDSDGRLDFYFTDSAIRCKNTLTFSLTKIVDNPNQLKYGSFNYAEFWDNENCTNYPERTNIPIPIPTSGLIFYKQ